MATTIVPGPEWDAVRARLAGDTVMVIGAADRGKSHLARWLVGQAGQRAALVSADVGQPSLGVPACLAMAHRRPWRTPQALWFAGDVTPVRHLLPIAVGTARLVERARGAGARLVVIDTGGLVDGPLGRLLKVHKALAARATDVIAVVDGDELGPLLAVVGTVARVHRVAPVPVAGARDRDERRAYRERRFRAHLRGAAPVRFDLRRVVGPSWSVGERPVPGTLVGLCDRDGFCLAVGIVHAIRARAVDVLVRRPPARTVASLRLGTLAVTPTGEELRAAR
ncbi:MAG TPA: Clp1/GlmU family protein [Candidatus Binatia bacterium]|nr:Clp1/GlmU family protein [Candidatus Binatia bacterium]